MIENVGMFKELTKNNMKEFHYWNTKSVNKCIEAHEKGVEIKVNPFSFNNINLKRVGINFELTEEELEIKELCKNDFTFFVENFCKFTKNDFSKLYPFQENILEQVKENQYNIGLVSRQVGMSTMTAFIIAYELCFESDKNILLVSHKLVVSSEILERVENILLNLPFFLKPALVTNSQTMLMNENNCKVTVTGRGHLALGSSIDFLIINDAAFVDFDKIMTNLAPCFKENCKHLYYSSHKGFNSFYELYLKSVAGFNNFKHFTVHWWDVPNRDDKWKETQIELMGLEKFQQQYELKFQEKLPN